MSQETAFYAVKIPELFPPKKFSSFFKMVFSQKDKLLYKKRKHSLLSLFILDNMYLF